MYPSSELVAERGPKTQGHTEDGPSGSGRHDTARPYLLNPRQPLKNSASRSQNTNFLQLKGGKKGQREARIWCERLASDGKRHQGGLRRPWVLSFLRPRFQNLKRPVSMLSSAEQVDSNPRPTAPRAPCTKSPPAFCCSQHLPPQPSSGPPPWSSGRLLAAHPKASVNAKRTSLWLPSPPPMALRNTHLPARSLWEPLEFMSWAKSCLTAAAIFLPAQPNRKRV